MMKNLTQEQIEVLDEIVKSGITKNFYLAGGTALTITYNHRKSDDFDFFLYPDKKIDFLSVAKKIKDIVIVDLRKDTLISMNNNIKCSFFKYPYPLLERPAFVKELQIAVSSDKDIAAMKAIAIIQRGEKKDFFDLWFLMKEKHWSIQNIIDFCQQKYGNLFNSSLFLKALVFFNDAEEQEIQQIDHHWQQIKKFFLQLTKCYIDDISRHG